jgi:molybdenum cofactor cytidylyltransferase
MTVGFVTGVVLAAGHSTRLGTPKQLLPYDDTTVLGATVAVARSCGFEQLIVTLGHDADAIRAQVRLDGVEVVIADDSVTGCSASLRSALRHVDPSADGIAMLLGDQPALTSGAVKRLLSRRRRAPIAVCRYRDGIGHPFWLGRSVFGELQRLHGDKGVWKWLESGHDRVAEVEVDGTVPLDVDTWDDYGRLLAAGPP